jgi:hypothetical protein
MLRISYFLDNRVTDGDRVGSLMRRPLSTFQKHYLVPINDIMKDRTNDHPVYSIMAQPTTLPRAPFIALKISKIRRGY